MARPPKGARDPQGAKAPGKPGETEGFEDPDGGELWSKNPNGRGYGWQDKVGNVWMPTGLGRTAHGGPHWDVQMADGTHVNVYPGGRLR
ncbi:MAG: polymorphic toxin type 37 domain-containing protein [Hyphomicrobiaceae bacterium]